MNVQRIMMSSFALVFLAMIFAACTPSYPSAPAQTIELCEQRDNEWCFESGDGAICDDELDLCLMRLAYELSDPSVCPLIDGDIAEENCFYNIARKIGDASLCQYTGLQEELCNERVVSP